MAKSINMLNFPKFIDSQFTLFIFQNYSYEKKWFELLNY